MLAKAPVAFVFSLLLAACQGAGPPDVHAPGQSGEVLMRVADDTAARGDLGTAAGLYRRAAELKPQDPQPLAKLGAVLLQLHAYTEAAASYRAALALTPNPIEGELHRGLAVVLLALDQPEGALGELDAAMAKAPQDPRLLNALGVAHDLMGRHDLAQQDYRNGLRLAPENAGLRNNYALSLALSQDYPAAVAALNELAGRSDASPRHRLNLALIYGLAGDDAKAAAIARTTLDEAAVANNLAYYAMLRGMDDKARANAIMGGPIRGPKVVEDKGKTATGAEPAAAAAAPREPVSAAPLVAAVEKPQPAAASPRASTSPPETATPPAPETPAAAPAPEVAPSAPQAADAPAADERPETGAPIVITKAEPAPAPPKAVAEPAAASPGGSPEAAPPAPTEQQAATAAPPAPPAVAEAADAAATKPVAGPAVDFVLQLGAFSMEPNAHRLAEHLSQKGYDAVVVHRRDRDGREWFVVRAGGYASADEAAAAARHLREVEQVPAMVVHLRQPNQA